MATILYKVHKDPVLDRELHYSEPTRGSKGAAGWDLYAAQEVIIEPFKPTLVPTRIDIAIPEGYMLLVLPRSGNALKNNLLIPNSPGLVDEDYRGHLGVILTWVPDITTVSLPDSHYRVDRGDRIAQAVLVKYEEQQWEKIDELPTSERGRNGFGSTGT